ncbi:MAG: GC-type dockerin domain-anchored protein [Phycisphaerales bacterium]
MLKIFTATILVAASIAHADRMFAVDSANDGLYVFDTQTGEIVRIVGRLSDDPTRFTTPTSMAVAPYGGIYIINNSPASDEGLSRVNPFTGRATHIGGDAFGSLSFGPEGQLYGIAPGRVLGTVDVATGIATPVGTDILPSNVFGLDFNRADGNLYAVTSPGAGAVPELVAVKPSNGNIVSIVSLSEPIVGSVPSSLVFESDGTLIMTSQTRRVWEIDPATGLMTLRVALGEAEPQGLDSIPCPADFNGDGSPDIFDFLAFQNAFDRGNPGADYDADGQLTLFDFLAFQNAFDAGC